MGEQTKNIAVGTANAVESRVGPKRSAFLNNPYVKNRALVLMLLPAIIYYLVFHYFPLYGVLIAFKDYRILDGVWDSPWAGFEYFKMAFSSIEFWRTFKNTLIISGLKLLVNFPAPIILALLLNEVRNKKLKSVMQTASYMPHFVSWVVLGGILMNFLSPSTGPVNAILKLLGMEPIYFLGSVDWFRPVLILSSMWKEIGWGTIIYLAALSGADEQLYEAAVLDGANRFKQTIYITLPTITPVIIINFIMSVGKIVNDDFDQIFNLYNPAVHSVGDVLSTYVYRVGLEDAQYSYSTAVGVFKNVISFALIILTNCVSKRVSDYSLW